MRESIATALQHIREFEGGYVSDPHDPGGCTNLGITIATYRRFINKGGTCRDLQSLGWAEAELVYRAIYWDAIRGDALPPGIDLLVFDHAVNAGPARAAKILQRLLGANDDGHIGEVTLARADRANPADLVRRYTAARIRYYQGLMTWWRFGKGWSRRAKAAETRALALV